MQQNTEQTPSSPSNSKTWIFVMAFFAVIGITALIFIMFFRQKPHSNANVVKRKIPAERAVFVTALSPLDAKGAERAAGLVFEHIGGDSSTTKMVVGGTHVYKQSTSLADFRERVAEALQFARSEELRTQGVLLSQTGTQLYTDMLPWDVFIFGEIAEGSDNTAIFRLRGFASSVEKRHNNFAPVRVHSFLGGNDSIATLFRSSLSGKTFEHIEHSLSELKTVSE